MKIVFPVNWESGRNQSPKKISNQSLNQSQTTTTQSEAEHQPITHVAQKPSLANHVQEPNGSQSHDANSVCGVI